MLQRFGDSGEGALSYVAIALLVGAIAAAVTVVAIPDSVIANIRAGVCEITRGGDCDPSGGDGRGGDVGPSPSAEPSTSGSSPSAAPSVSPAGTTTPEQQEYEAAQNALSRAENELGPLEQEWANFNLLAEIGKLGLDFLAGDIINCVKKPNFGDCIWALIGIVPWGKIGKFLKSIPKIAKLIDRFLDLKRRLDKARKARKDARSRLDRALEACQRKKPGNSFLPGTPVLMADGTRRPIERVRVGDLVWANDPLTGRGGPRRVTARIVGTGAKDLVDVTVDLDGVLGGPTAHVTATANHPFWVVGADDWIDAGDLVFGDALGARSGRAMVIDFRHRHRDLTVYNLTVEDLHTYFVAAGPRHLLVHNDPTPGPGGCGVDPNDPIEKKIREAGYTDPLPSGVRRHGRGIIDESEKGFDDDERKIAEKLAEEGKIVKAKEERAQRGETGRTGDSEVDGVPTEFKTLRGDKKNPTPNHNTVKRTLDSATGQAQHSVLNAQGSGMSRDQAMKGIRRYLGQPHANQKSIRVFGDGWEINCAPSPEHGGQMWCT
ncbi:polymorphic toxin-type HINT domain-containing protein [Actinomadura miaoliensis]|uniref:Hint domain-containing protein n=1 Tax=Actinomadura miaoliensis TaxID=430685 RepID=A0ABP7W6U3_9ACTN